MLAHTDFPLSDVATVLANFPGLVAPWPGARWSWDIRYACAVSVVRVEDWGPVEAILAKSLAQRVDCTEVGHLGTRQRSAIARFGGIRYGQHGFADGDRLGPLRLALVWPWTDGVHVSIRLAIA